MKQLTIFPMSSYRNKIYGLIITVVSLVLLLVISIRGPLPLIQADADGQFNLFFAIVTFGLYMIAWSKEKNDDERAQRIRAKALQAGFGTMVAGMMAFTFCFNVMSIKKHQPMTIEIGDLSLFLVFGLTVYLAIFYIGLLFDPAWVYNDDTVMVNVKKNKQFFVIYSVAIIIIFLLIFLFHKK